LQRWWWWWWGWWWWWWYYLCQHVWWLVSRPIPAKGDGGKKKAKPKKEEVIYEYKKNHQKGTKKDTAYEFPSAYQPKYVEAAWQDWW